MSPLRARWRNACILGAPLLLICGMVVSQSPVIPLLPVKESPQLLPVPKAPSELGARGPASPAVLAPTVPFSSKTPSSTSVSKQFTVYGGDLQMRSSFCMLCEDTAAALGRVLKDSGKYVLPVIVVLKTPPDITVTGPAVTYNIGELAHGGFHLQLNAQLRTGFNTTEFSNELVRMLLAERILRNHQKLQTSRNDVLPAWVMTGVTQALDFRSRSRPSALFSAVFRRGQVYSLDRILAADPTQLDALSKGIYETSTCALVLTLLDQPDGPVRFAKFLNALAVESKPDRELLTQHFPNLASSQSALEKWWSLQMASLATPSVMETYGVTQTEEALDEALMLSLPGAREEKKEAAPVAAAPETDVKKQAGSLFGWLKRGSKEESVAAPEGEAKAQEKPKTEEAKAKTEEPKDKGKADATPPASTEGEPAPPESKSFFRSIFPGGKKTAFPFSRKKADEAVDVPSDEKAKADKGKDTEKEKPKDEKKPEPAKPDAAPQKGKDAEAKAEEPAAVPKLSRKPGQTRSIGGRPEDLPKAPPVAPVKTKETPPAEPKKTEKDKEKSQTAEANATSADGDADKPSRFNPRNWFRKDPQTAEETPEKGKESNKPASRGEGRSGSNVAVAERTHSPRARTVRPGNIPLEDFAMIAKHPDRIDILNTCMAKLASLKQRAHPLYKPVIADYTLVVQELLQGKTKGVADRLESLRQLREKTHEKAIGVESYLDWYEANHTGTLSHSFDDFLKLDDELTKERLPRNDALSKYLDAVQQEFQEK